MAAPTLTVLTELVDPLTILTDAQIATEEVSLLTLSMEIADNFQLLQWAARHRLVANSVTCATCDMPARLNRYTEGTDGFRWRCNQHNFVKSVRHGSFFAKSHMSMQKLIAFMHMWLFDLPQRYIGFELGFKENSHRTVADWSQFLRDICVEYVDRNPPLLGGIDFTTGEPLTVEIDESKYFHSKYNLGHWTEDHWVFGGVERETGKCFMEDVPDMRAETLVPLVKRHILPGTRIVSDGWASYADIGNIDNGIYLHDVVGQEHKSEDPQDPTIHTKSMEILWLRAKRKLRKQVGASKALFPSYLDQFVWRNNQRDRRSVLGDFIVTINTVYGF